MPDEPWTLVPLGTVLESALGSRAIEMAVAGKSEATMNGYRGDLEKFDAWRSQDVGQAVAALLAMDPTLPGPVLGSSSAAPGHSPGCCR